MEGADYCDPHPEGKWQLCGGMPCRLRSERLPEARRPPPGHGLSCRLSIRLTGDRRIRSMHTSSTPAELNHFIELLRTFHTAMLVTVGESDSFHARPMAIAQVEDNGRVWFLSASDSGKIAEIEADRHVSLTAQRGDSAFIALSGRALLVEDRGKAAELWREPYRVWFPGGKDDPKLELIAVTPVRGEYWDTTGGSRLSYWWEAAKAYVTGTTPEVKEGPQHGKVALQ